MTSAPTAENEDPGPKLFSAGIPHAEALGIAFVRRQPRGLVYRLPWRADLIGHPAVGSIFSGAVWTLLDHAMGVACTEAVAPERATATIDLRVDYLRPSRTGVALLASVEYTRIARQVAFARGEVHHEDEPEGEPLALAQGTFMVFDRPAAWGPPSP